MKRISSRFLLTAFLFSLVKITAAQTEETISADRPDQTEATYILPKNNFQLSDGFLIARETFQNDLTLRYGLFKHTEIRTSLSFGSYPDKFQLQPIQLTLKRKLSEGEKSLPSISLIATAELEMLASKDLKSDKIPVQVIFAFEHDIQKNTLSAIIWGRPPGLRICILPWKQVVK